MTISRLGGNSKCKKCGQPIRWLLTENSKPVPVNPMLLFLKADKAGEEQAITISGKYIKGTKADPEDPQAVGCFVAHFATCPSAAQFRRPTKPKPKEEDQQPRLFGYE
jgi:hypothetical protein